MYPHRSCQTDKLFRTEGAVAAHSSLGCSGQRPATADCGMLLACVLGLSSAETMVAEHRYKMNPQKRGFLSVDSTYQLRKNVDTGMGK